MVKAGEIRPGMPQAAQQRDAKRAEHHQKGKLTAQDQVRIASQAGFQPTDRKKRKRGFDVGDSSHAPIPLPDDDINGEAWTSERLDNAQERLAVASSELGSGAQLDEQMSIVDIAVNAGFLPTEDSLAALEDLAKRPAPEAIRMDEVTRSVERLFGIRISEKVPVGHQLLAAGLIAAGESGLVGGAPGGLDEAQLLLGLQRVTEKSNQAVGEAQRMTKGIDRQLSVQRTFVFKR